MKTIKFKFFILFLLIFIKTSGQTKESFVQSFVTDSGIYGSIYLSTKPLTFSEPYLQIQADKVIIERVKTSHGSILRSNDLSKYGISFPMQCSNCYFYANGSVYMGLHVGTFKNGAAITVGGALGNANQLINFSSSAIEEHRKAVKDGKGSLWEKIGRVATINISKVSGADFGQIIDAIKKYEIELKNKEKISQILRSLINSPKTEGDLIHNLKKYQELSTIDKNSEYDSKIQELQNRIQELKKDFEDKEKTTQILNTLITSPTSERDLQFNLEKYEQLSSIADNPQYESKIQEIRNRIKQIAEEAEASNLDLKLVNNDNKEDTSNEKRDFDNKSFSKDKDSNEDLKRNQETQKSIKDKSYRKAEMEIRFRDQEKFISSNYYVKSGDYLRALVELNQVSGYNYSTAREEIKKIQYQALGQLSEQNLSRLKKYTQNINFNAKDANQVLTDYQKKYNYIVSEFNKSKSNIVSKTVTIAAQRVGENLGQGKNADAAAEGIIGIISATSAAQEAKDAREEAVRELNYKKNNTLYKLRDDLLKEYQDASNYYYEQAIKSTAENNEIVATSNYEYYECRLASIKSNFSTENANWAKNGKCIPQKNNKINTELKNNNFYEISIRKFYQALKYPYDSKERKDFLAASELYLSKVSTLDNLALETNNMVITILLASDSKKLKDLRKKSHQISSPQWMNKIL